MQGRILAKSDIKERDNQLCTAVSSTFTIINGDNQLEMKEIKKEIDICKYDLKIKTNYTSVSEAGKFINIAGKEIIDKHKI